MECLGSQTVIMCDASSVWAERERKGALNKKVLSMQGREGETGQEDGGKIVWREMDSERLPRNPKTDLLALSTWMPTGYYWLR